MSLVPSHHLRPYMAENSDWQIIFDGSRHLIQTPHWSFKVDFDEFNFISIKQNPFFRFFKVCKKKHIICDVTAGLGRDSYLLSQLGYSLISIERHPVLMTLFAEARERCDNNLFPDWHLLFGNCEDLLQSNIAPDTIYFDPMFENRKKAMTQKYTQVIRHYCQDSADNTTYEFLYTYCKDNKKRLIIKQPTTGASKSFSKPHQIITLSRMSNLWLYQF